MPSGLILYQSYRFTVIHKQGVENKVANALSRKRHLLSFVSPQVIGFNTIKEQYKDGKDFNTLYANSLEGKTAKYSEFNIVDGFQVKSNRLCIPNTSIREFLVWQIHQGGLVGHFGQDKTLKDVEHRFYWPKMKIYITKLVA